MEASLVSELGKPQHNEPLQMHSMPSWKRYESEEEEVSETSSLRAFTPTEGESGNDDTVDESGSERGHNTVLDNGLLSPAREFSDESSSLYSRRLSVVTTKRNSAVQHSADNGTETEDEGLTPAGEYVTPPVSPTYLSSDYYIPYVSADLDTAVVTEDDEDEPEVVEEVCEAKQVLYMAPTSRPSIIFIHNFTLQSGDAPDESQGRPENLRKRSSTASGMSSPDRSKRYSAMFFREISKDGEVAYVGTRNHVRARSNQRQGGSPYRSRGLSPANPGNTTTETRPQRLRRNASQRSTRNSYIAPDEVPRARSRPRSIRSSSTASDNSSSTSSRSHMHNSSTASSQTSASSIDLRSVESDKTRPVPHPLSIITTLSPTTVRLSGPFGSTDANTSGPTLHAHSASNRNDVSPTNSPWDQINSASTIGDGIPHILRPGIYSLRHNPSLAPNDLLPEDSMADHRQEPQQHRRDSKDWSISSPVSAKFSKSTGASTMKSLMTGFRGLGRPHKRSLAPAPN